MNQIRLTAGAVAATVALSSLGCASMMVQVKDVDESGADVTLAEGDSLAIATPEVAVKVKGDEGGKALAKKLERRLEQEFEERGVATDDSSDAKLEVTVTKYKKGCGFCRGFFPVFGLGNSFVDGEAVLETDAGERELVVAKKGQITGTSQMGDQTDQNVKFFATALAKKVCDDDSEDEKGEQDEKKGKKK